MINRSLNLLYPPMKLRLDAALEKAHSQGLHAYVFEGWRSGERQNKLYSQGRGAPGPVVTWVKSGYSWHNYGLAIDLVFDADPLTKKIEWTWEVEYADKHRDAYKELSVILKAAGFQWLGDKNIERAHFQMTFGLGVEQAKQIVDAQGILGLWAECDKRILTENIYA